MEEEKYMWRCIELAQNGFGHTSPNPTVGAVIVCDGKIIGEGYHIRCGEGHAEVNAIRSVKNPSLLRRSTLYVSLEPCSHYGKTPPCADLIVEKEIPRIVVGCLDPSAKVAGKGVQKLRAAGREVVVGVLEEECSRLIRRFVVFNTLHRPYVILKWAESADRFLDKERGGGAPVRLSSPLTTMWVHKKRSEVDGIMVGRRTALLDNPSLTVRHWYGKQPVRIVLDRTLSLPHHLHLFEDDLPTIVFTEKSCPDCRQVSYIKIDFGGDVLRQVMAALHARNIQTLLVEGGGRLLQSVIDARLWDEAFVEESPMLLHTGVDAPFIRQAEGYEVEVHFGHVMRHYVRYNAKGMFEAD